MPRRYLTSGLLLVLLMRAPSWEKRPVVVFFFPFFASLPVANSPVFADRFLPFPFPWKEGSEAGAASTGPTDEVAATFRDHRERVGVPL